MRPQIQPWRCANLWENERVAQLVEHRPFKALVLGSNPSPLTSLSAAETPGSRSIGTSQTEASGILKNSQAAQKHTQTIRAGLRKDVQGVARPTKPWKRPRRRERIFQHDQHSFSMTIPPAWTILDPHQVVASSPPINRITRMNGALLTKRGSCTVPTAEIRAPAFAWLCVTLSLRGDFVPLVFHPESKAAVSSFRLLRQGDLASRIQETGCPYTAEKERSTKFR